MALLLHTEASGEGPPVVLLHGLFGQARNLGVVARALAADHRVISMDLRNHGASPHAPGMGYEALAGDVLATLNAVGISRAAWIGHSMGGKTAMAAALLRPDAVARLLVADIAPVAYAHGNAEITAAMLAVDAGPATTRAQVMAALEAAVPDQAVRAFLAQNFTPGVGWRIGLAEIAAGIADIEGWPDFGAAQYGGPTLFVAGGRSKYVRPAHQAAIARLFPRARVEKIEAAGHWLHADAPAAFNAVVREFLES